METAHAERFVFVTLRGDLGKKILDASGAVCQDYNHQFIKDSWFTMYRTNNSSKSVAIAECYLDDSGSEGTSKVVVIGGLILDRAELLRFDDNWQRMLRRHRIESLHMADFVRPYGKYVGWHKELKMNLFLNVLKILNGTKVYSLSLSIDHIEYKAAMPTRIYKTSLGAYTVAFIGAMELNSQMAEQNGWPDRLAYLVDETRVWRNQLSEAHLICRSFEKQQKRRMRTVGTLTFGDDEQIAALQAADVIAWSVRRRQDVGLTEEYEPLKKLFEERFRADGRTPVRPHVHCSVPHSHGQRVVQMMNSDAEGLITEMRRSVRALRAEGTIEG